VFEALDVVEDTLAGKPVMHPNNPLLVVNGERRDRSE
jgi:hypothetical protein